MQIPTPLEQALATQSSKQSSDGSSPIHLVAVIASYIHHHDDPHLPAGQQTLLFKLSLSPRSDLLSSLIPSLLPSLPHSLLPSSPLSPTTSLLPYFTNLFISSLSHFTHFFPNLLISSPSP